MAIQAALLHDQIATEAHVARVALDEGLSRIFDCEVLFELRDPDLDLSALLGSTALVQIWDDRFDASDPAHARFVHGVIEEAEYVAPLVPEGHSYRVRLRPHVNALAYRVRTRIFQKLSPIDVIKTLMKEAGVPPDSVGWSVDNYTARDYVTQWKESELAFAMRWLEELGVHFFFEHDETGHMMVVSDRAAQHEPIAGETVIPVRGRTESNAWFQDEGLYDVRMETRFRHDRWSARDWNFMTPDAPRQTTAGNGGFERYDFPGGYPDDETATWLSGVRAEEMIHDQYLLTGNTDCRRLSAGRTFELGECTQDALMVSYLVSRARHVYERGDRAEEGGTWRTDFEAFPAHIPYRPPRITPRPKVYGKESAVVTGPGGEEIHVDKVGAIKVHFYWDRENPVDDTASCWIRVQQLNTAGTMALPRVGWEVDVGFEYGDPDRPVVLQKLYNAEQMPPYALPANLMQSALQTSSSPGGGGTNEIRMNDANGGQEYFVHAQKDMATTVGNDSSETIAANSTVQVGSDYIHKVGADESISIGGNQSLSITGVWVSDTVASQTVTVGGLDDWGVGGVHTVTVTGSRTDDVSGLMNVLACGVGHTFNAGHTMKVGGALAFTAVGPIAENVAAGKTEMVGGAKLEIISKSKSENVGVGKVLNSGAVNVKAGTDVNVGAEGALAISTGGPLKSKCGGDFGISGRSVTFNIAGSLKMQAGSKITASPGQITIKGSSVGGEGAKVLLKGEIHYK